MPTLRGQIEELCRSEAAAGGAGAVFRREGEFWTIDYEDTTLRLSDVKGLRYIAILLARPGDDVHSLELVQAADGLPPRQAGPAAAAAASELGSSAAAEAAVLDAQAKEAYRQRLQELGADLQQARDWNDPERTALLEEEIDRLTDELARATGLGGRDRELPSSAERARVSVTKAIRAAVKTIERHHPALGSHLAASIRTGRFCAYGPPGEAPPDWSL